MEFDALDWDHVGEVLDAEGHAVIERLLALDECRSIADLYGRDEVFRSRVVMSRHGFGRGEYKYFSYPLPNSVAQLRTYGLLKLTLRDGGFESVFLPVTGAPFDLYLGTCH